MTSRNDDVPDTRATDGTPVIDVPLLDAEGALAGDTAALAAAGAGLDAACRSVGFFAITGHDVERSLIDDVVESARDDHPARYEPVVAGEWLTAKSLAMLD